MKITTSWITNLKTKEVEDKVKKAVKKGLVDTVAAIASDAKKESPFLHGHNRRSIQFEVGPGKPIAQKEGEGAIYSTSGYGGWLEVGTHKEGGGWRMPPRPYFKPALDKNIKNLPKNIKAHLP